MDDDSKELLFSAAELLEQLAEWMRDEDITKEQLRLASHSLGVARQTVKCVLKGLEFPN